jgi:phosphatidylcholine synthase
MKLAAACVHILTASGVLAGFQALLATIAHRWDAAFLWLAIATLIDGIDGPLARRFKVKTHLARFSGERLDLVIDYFTYVIVPALMIYASGLVPAGLGWLAAAIVLMTSLFHFSDKESKTEDGFFVGFPAIWNIVAFLLFVFAPPPALGFAVIALLGGLTFVPLKWVHPVRVRRWRPLTIAVLASWAAAGAAALQQGFPPSTAVQMAIALCSLYLLAFGLMRSIGEPGEPAGD